MIAAVAAVPQEIDSVEAPTMITLEDALRIALSENVSVKVADKEIERTGYAKKGAYASLFPQIDGSASYQRTIKKQVMYMDFDMPGMGGGSDESGGGAGGITPGGGIEVGRWNTWSTGLTAAMPLVNAQLWQSLKISAQDVELAVEKARGSRLEMVTQVKNAYFNVLLAKETFDVYKNVYENALANYNRTELKYNAKKASELDLTRAKSTLQNSIPEVYDAESSIVLGLWQLKAVMGVDLDMNIDVTGSLRDYAETMFYDIHSNDDPSLDRNTSLRQLAIQAEELANTIKLQQYAYIPSLAVSFSYSLNAMTNDFKFSEYKWSPYSAVGLSLSIPIFSGGKRLNQVKQAKVQYSELEMQRYETERQLRIAIRQYLNVMETAMQNYTAAQVAEQTANKAYEIARSSYEVGKSTLTDLNDALLALVRAQLSVSQSIYSFIVAKSGLEQTLGKDFNEETNE